MKCKNIIIVNSIILLAILVQSGTTLTFGQPKIEDFVNKTGDEAYRAVYVKPDSYGDSAIMVGTNKGKALFSRGKIEDSLFKFEFRPFNLSPQSNGLVRSINYLSETQGFILTSDGIYSSKSNSPVWTQIADINKDEFANSRDSVAELWGMSFVNKSGRICVDGVYFKRDSDDIDKELLLCTNNIFANTIQWDEPNINRKDQTEQIQLTNIYFDNNQRGWAVGTDGVEGIVWNSINGGADWTKQDVSMINEPLLGVTGTGNKIFVIGYNGVIYSKESIAKSSRTNRDTRVIGKADEEIKLGDIVKIQGGILGDYLPNIPGVDSISEVFGRVVKVNKVTGMLRVTITKVSPKTFFNLVRDQFSQKDVPTSKVTIENMKRSNTKINDDDSKVDKTDQSVSSDWKKINISSKETLRSIKFSDDGSIGFIVGNKGTILYSTDSGESWKNVLADKNMKGKQRDITSTDFYSIFIDKVYCWVVGSNGAIAKINISDMFTNKDKITTGN